MFLDLLRRRPTWPCFFVVLGGAMLCAFSYQRAATLKADAIADVVATETASARNRALAISRPIDEMLGQVRALHGLAYVASVAHEHGDKELEKIIDIELAAWRVTGGVEVAQIGVIDPDGIMRWTNIEKGNPRLDLSDREHFLAIARDGAKAFISAPVIGRITGKSTVQFTAGYYRLDGSLDRISVVSILAAKLNDLGTGRSEQSDAHLTIVRDDMTVIARGAGTTDREVAPEHLAALKILMATPEGVTRQPASGQSGISPSSDTVADETNDQILVWQTVADGSLIVLLRVDLEQWLAALAPRLNGITRVALLFMATIVVASACLVLAIRKQQIFRANQVRMAILRDSEGLFRQIAEGMPDVIALVNHDARIVYVNPAIRQVFGLEPDAVIGRSMGDFVAMHDRPRMAILQLVNDPVGTQARRETQVLRPDGKVFWIDINMRRIGETKNNLSDPVVVCVIRDLTQRREMELELQIAKVRLEDLLTSMQASLYQSRLHPDGTTEVTWTSDSANQLTGYSAAEMNEVGWFMSRLDESSIKQWQEHHKRLVNEGSSSAVVHFRRKDGRWIWMAISSKQSQYENDHTIMECHVRDITREHERTMQHAHTAKLAQLGETLTGLAHELNQPLAGISMIAENALLALDDRYPDSAGIRRRLERIVGQAGRASLIIDHMRVFGRGSPQDPVDFQIGDAIGEVIAVLESRLQLASITVRQEFDEAVPTILGHPVSLEQVLINIIGNAADAVETHNPPLLAQDREIYVGLQRQADCAVVRISDRAGGIDPHILPRIFEPFFTTKRVGNGMGLGLSISYGIIQDMGGTLTAYNDGGGSVFEIRLALNKQDHVHQNQQELPSSIA